MPSNVPFSKMLYMQLKIVYGAEGDPPLDVALMEEADAFIANCVSAFSAVAKRGRAHLGKRTDFWGFPRQKIKIEWRYLF